MADGLSRASWSPEEDANAASRAVIDEGKARAAGRQRHPVDLHSGDASRHPARVLDRDLVAGRVVPKRDLEMAPGARNAWIEVEDRPPQAESEQPLDPGSVHPRCGPGIPGPYAAAHVGGLGIDVGGRHLGLHLVSMYPPPGARSVDRVQDREELVGLVAVTKRGEGHHGPDGGMRILAAILANARRITLDLAGVAIRVIERRGEQQDQLLAAPDEILLDGGQRPRRPDWLGGARDHSPRLRDRINATFRIDGGPQGSPVVEIGATIPVSVPSVLVEGGPEGAHVISPRAGARVLATGVGHLRELPERRMEKPPEPDAFPPPFGP